MSNCPTCGRPRWDGRNTLMVDAPCLSRNGPDCVAYATVALYSDTLDWLRATGHAGEVRRAIEQAKRGCPELQGEESFACSCSLAHRSRTPMDRTKLEELARRIDILAFQLDQDADRRNVSLDLLDCARDLRAALAAAEPPPPVASQGEAPPDSRYLFAAAREASHVTALHADDAHRVISAKQALIHAAFQYVYGVAKWFGRPRAVAEPTAETAGRGEREACCGRNDCTHGRPPQTGSERCDCAPAPSPAETTAKSTCRTCRHWTEQASGVGTCTATDTPAYETDSCEGHEPSPAPAETTGTGLSPTPTGEDEARAAGLSEAADMLVNMWDEGEQGPLRREIEQYAEILLIRERARALLAASQHAIRHGPTKPVAASLNEEKAPVTKDVTQDRKWVRETPRTAEEQTRLRAKAVTHYCTHILGASEEDVKYTCDDCDLAPRCKLAFDCYNTNGDCLLEK